MIANHTTPPTSAHNDDLVKVRVTFYKNLGSVCHIGPPGMKYSGSPDSSIHACPVAMMRSHLHVANDTYDIEIPFFLAKRMNLESCILSFSQGKFHDQV